MRTRLVVLWLFAAVVSAQAFTVDTTTDEPDAVPEDGLCLTVSGACSLRAALSQTSPFISIDIDLPPGRYVLSLGPLTTAQAARLVGSDAATTIIDGAGSSALFSGGDYFINDVTLTGGNAPAGAVVSGGHIDLKRVTLVDNQGARLLEKTNCANGIIISDSTIVRNSGEISSTCGGGISVDRSTFTDNSNFSISPQSGGIGGVTVTRSQFLRSGGVESTCMAGTGFRIEDSTIDGGGVSGRGAVVATTIRNSPSCAVSGCRPVTVTDSIIENNASGICMRPYNDGGPPRQGFLTVLRSEVRNNVHSGISLDSSSLDLVDSWVHDNQGGGVKGGNRITIERSTLSGNRSPLNGGGLSVLGPVFVTIRNSTVSGNHADGSGGGIYRSPGFGSSPDGGTLVLQHATIVNNRADADANGSGDGGGILYDGPGEGFSAEASIIAENHSTGGPAQDCAGTLVSAGYNLIQSTAGCTISGDTTSDLLWIAPDLGPLSANGGPAPTHAPSATSPVVDAVGGTCSTPVDQRDFVRPAGPRCDIGSVELGAVATTTSTTTTTETSTTTTTLQLVGVPTRFLSIRDRFQPAPDPSFRRIRFRSETRAGAPNQISIPAVGSSADPTLHGATLHVYNSTGQTADQVSIPLPAARWRFGGRPVGYEFSAPPGSPITRITLRSKVITILGGGAAFGYTLNEPAQGGVAVNLVLGDTTGWCADARPRPSSMGRNDTVDYFAAESIPRPPLVCPSLP